MSYTIKLTSEESTWNNADYIQFILTFTVDETGSDQQYSWSEKGLNIKNAGTLEWNYNIEDAFLIPGSTRLSIADKLDYLDGLFFGSTTEQVGADKQPKLEIKLNGTTEFLGYVVEDSVLSDTGVKVVSFMANPRTDIINKTMLYNGDVILDPLEHTWGGITVNITNAVYDPLDPLIVTVTHTSNSSLTTGDSVRIKNVTGMTDLNGAFIIDKNSNTEFEVDLVTDQLYISGGTWTLQDAPALANSPLLYLTLEDIYQLVDSSISYSSGSLEIYHDWTFLTSAASFGLGRNITNATHSAGTVTVTHDADSPPYYTGLSVIIKDVGGMTDLNDQFTITVVDTTHFTVSLETTQSYTSGGMVRKATGNTKAITGIKVGDAKLFFTPDSGLSTVGDVLRDLAKGFFAYTGMIHEGKAFFKKLFYYDTSNLQTLGNILNIQREYRYPVLDYVSFGTTLDNTRSYKAGTFTELDGKSLVVSDLLCAFYGDVTGGDSLVSGTIDPVWNVKDPSFSNSTGQWFSNLFLLAQLWYDSRGSIQNSRVDKFTVVGVDYDFLKSFNYGGYKYQIIGMRKNWEKSTTEIEALYLGAL